MELIYIILSCICFFVIIYFAVRLAISPIIPNNEDTTIREDTLSVIDLRDIGLFDNDEIEDILRLFQNKDVERKNNIKFEKYSHILKELNHFGYLDNDQLEEKINHLKKMFEIE